MQKEAKAHLAVFSILNAKADSLADLIKRQQRCVDFERRDLLASTVDELLDTPGKLQVSTLMDTALVARPEVVMSAVQ